MQLYMPKLHFLTFVAVQFSCYSENLTYPIACHQSPKIIEGPPAKQYFNTGSRLTLSCRVSGCPIPKISWYIDSLKVTQKEIIIHSHQMKQSNYSSILIINTKSLKEFNTIYCKAHSMEGLVISNVSILTQAVLREDQPQRPPYNVTATEGRSLSLQCGHVTSTPHPSIAWFIVETGSRNSNAQPVHFDEHVTTNAKGHLIFTSTSKSNERTYKCQAYNYVLRKTSAGSYFRISVVAGDFQHHQPPDIIYTSSIISTVASDNITLTCIFSGLPQPEITWSKDNKLLPKNLQIDYGRKIKIANVSLEDAGIYKCAGRNGHGERHSLISVDVGVAPMMISPMSDQFGSFGTSLVFSCNCTGHPQPSYDWSVNTRNINESSLAWLQKENILILMNPEEILRSTITCNASNVHGYVLLYAQATVMGHSTSQSPTKNSFLTPPTEEKITNFDADIILNVSWKEIYQNENISGFYAHSQNEEPVYPQSFSVFNFIWLFLFLMFVVFIVIFIYYRSKNRLFTYQVTKVTFRCQGTSPPMELKGQTSFIDQ